MYSTCAYRTTEIYVNLLIPEVLNTENPFFCKMPLQNSTF